MSIVKSARTNLGLAQSGMASYIKNHGHLCNAKQISDWENGRKQPRKEIRELLGIYAARAVIKELNNQPYCNHETIIMEMMK